MLIMSRLLSIILRRSYIPFQLLYSAQNIGKEIVDWLVEHERTNEKLSNSHIPEGAQNPRKKSNSVLFPCPSVCRRESLQGSVCKCKNQKPEISQKQPRCNVCTATPFWKNKRCLLGCWLSFSSKCVCLHVHAHTQRLCGAECASVFSSIFNIFKILNENVAVNLN